MSCQCYRLSCSECVRRIKVACEEEYTPPPDLPQIIHDLRTQLAAKERECEELKRRWAEHEAGINRQVDRIFREITHDYVN